MRWILGFWYNRTRKLDLEILWPICKKQAKDLDSAKAAFAVHAYNDPGWLFLGKDNIYKIIDELN